MTVQEVIEALTPDYGHDAWSDDVKPRLGDALEALSRDGWAELAAAAPHLPPGPRIRLANALVVVDQDRAEDLLVELIRAPEPEVGAAAAAALLDRRFEWTPGVDLRADVERHLGAAPAEGRAVLERLLTRVPR